MGADTAPTFAADTTSRVSNPRTSVGSALFHFIDCNGDQQPAVLGSQLKGWLAQGVITEDTYVWAEDGSTPDWAPLRQAGALFTYCEQPMEGGWPGSKSSVLSNRLHASQI